MSFVKQSMQVIRFAVLAAALCLPGVGQASLDELFDVMGHRYGIDSDLLRAVAYQESKFHPWSINVNKEGFFPRSKQEAIDLLRQLDKNRWLLTTWYGKRKVREFYASEAAAKRGLASKSGVTKHALRYVNVKSTDVGLMQVNWMYHGKNAPSLDRLFDPDWNVAYGAHFLSGLVRQYGLREGLARYNAGTKFHNGLGYAQKVMRYYRGYQLKREQHVASR